MAETIVENQICSICDADVRKGALFCYNCGSSVAPEIITPRAEKIDNEDQVIIKKDFTKNGQKTRQKKQKNKPENDLAPLEEVAEKPITKPEIQPETTLKSAASLRNKSKSAQVKKVEIVWEEHENAPNIWFILTVIFLSISSILVVWLVLQLK